MEQVIHSHLKLGDTKIPIIFKHDNTEIYLKYPFLNGISQFKTSANFNLY